MAPPVQPPAPKSFDPSKSGKYIVRIGDTIRQDLGIDFNKRKSYTSLRYNHKPTNVLNNGKRAVLKKNAQGSPNSVDLSITPSDDRNEVVTFGGAQAPAKKTECVLIYDPAAGTFTLEKLTSHFTLNLMGKGASEHQPLPIPRYKASFSDDSGSESDGTDDEPDPSNPFDFRHFIGKEVDVPVTSSKLKADETRRERLEKFQESLSARSGTDDEEDGDEDRESRSGSVASPPATAPASTQTLPTRTRGPPVSGLPKQKTNVKTVPKKAVNPTSKPSPATGGGSLREAPIKSPAGLVLPTSTLSSSSSATNTTTVGVKRKSPDDAHESASGSDAESDADDESEESDEDEEDAGVSGELIVEEDVDERNNRSRSATAGAWFGGGNHGNNGPPVPLRNTPLMRTRSTSSNDADGSFELPSARSPPRPMGPRRIDEEEEESSDEDEDEDTRPPPLPRHIPMETAPSPGVPQSSRPIQVEDDESVSEEDEEEDADGEPEFELEDLLKAALGRGVGALNTPTTTMVDGPVSLRGMAGRKEEEEESSSEEE